MKEFYKIKKGEEIMNKTQLVEAIVEKTGLKKKEAEAALNATTDAIAEALKAGDKVQLVGFGTFDVKERAAREGRNPRTGETIKIAACKHPTFTAGKALKDSVN
jgi:DNA-binding protein HU-beta